MARIQYFLSSEEAEILNRDEGRYYKKLPGYNT